MVVSAQQCNDAILNMEYNHVHKFQNLVEYILLLIAFILLYCYQIKKTKYFRLQWYDEL